MEKVSSASRRRQVAKGGEGRRHLVLGLHTNTPTRPPEFTKTKHLHVSCCLHKYIEQSMSTGGSTVYYTAITDGTRDRHWLPWPVGSSSLQFSRFF